MAGPPPELPPDSIPSRARRGLGRRVPVGRRVAAGQRPLRRPGTGHGLGPARYPWSRTRKPARWSGCWPSRQRATPVWRLDITEWHFINPELTVHLHREAAGEWVCLDAQTAISVGAGRPGDLRPLGHPWAAGRGRPVAARQPPEASAAPSAGLLVHNRVPLPPAADQPGVRNAERCSDTVLAARRCRRARVWVEAARRATQQRAPGAAEQPGHASDCGVRAGCHSSAMPRAG